MTPERWRRIEELFHAAHAKSQDQRAAFLVEACQGDEALRRQVESLLNESESDDGFLAEPPLVLPADMLRELAPANMAGRSVAGYQLQTLLGAGGMGEVYRARDPKLGRDVAIKILPRAFTSDPDRLARFEREARMLAALNHPNICGIYGLEEAEGIRFLILELVEGETLAEKLAHPSKMHANGEGLPVGQALLIARQIAEALEVAHDKGIIHRDLKPANVKITPDGVVKVLDFGLAKSIGAEGTSPGLTHSPEPTRGGARQGAIIGTAAYMSPEQARGLPVDKRTDIWAFGCVLYEMVTGRVAFGMVGVAARDPRAGSAAAAPRSRQGSEEAFEGYRRRQDRDRHHRRAVTGDVRSDGSIDKCRRENAHGVGAMGGSRGARSRYRDLGGRARGDQ